MASPGCQSPGCSLGFTGSIKLRATRGTIPVDPQAMTGVFPVRDVIISYEGHGAGYRTLLAS